MRRVALALAILLHSAGAGVRADDPPAPTPVDARPPNIVHIDVDDLGWTDLACQGSTFYETPHIDALAARGMRFTNAYAPAANCAPSRASCMTGTYAPRHGIYTVGSSARGPASARRLIPTPNRTELADAQVTIAEILRARGYATGHFGKWHLGPDPTTQGFDVNVAGCAWGSPSGGGHLSPYDYPNCAQPEPGECLAARLGAEASAFIAQHRDGPFFVHLATYAVHAPLQADPDDVAHFRARTPNAAHRNATYAAMIRSVDECVAQVLRTLDELHLAERTLVILTSDNGGVWATSRQWPLRAGKGSSYEGGLRVPFVACWPGRVASGTTCDVPVIGIDLLPTVLAAAELSPPEGKVLDGLSLLPLLEGTGTLPERPLFWHFPIYLEGGNPETRDPAFRTRPGSALRLGDWKLHEFFEDGALELYDLAHDPGERHDLAAARPEKAQELRAILAAWRETTGAPVPTERNPKFVEPSTAPTAP